MRCLLAVTAAGLLSGCLMTRGWVVVRNQSGLDCTEIHIRSPDFQRRLIRLNHDADFRIYEDISFRRSWRVESRFVDGSVRLAHSTTDDDSWNQVVITIAADQIRIEPERDRAAR
jgi:hypothetical protein